MLVRFICVCLCVCVYIYVHLSVPMYTCMRLHKYDCVQTCVQTYKCMCICVRALAMHLSKFNCEYVLVLSSVLVDVSVWINLLSFLPVYMHMCINVDKYINIGNILTKRGSSPMKRTYFLAAFLNSCAFVR